MIQTRCLLFALTLLCGAITPPASSGQSYMGVYSGLTLARLYKPFVANYPPPNDPLFLISLNDQFHPGITLGAGWEIPLSERLVTSLGIGLVQKANRQTFSPFLFDPLEGDSIMSITTISNFIEFPIHFRYTLLSSESGRLRLGTGIGLSDWSRRKIRQSFREGGRSTQINAVGKTFVTRTFELTAQFSLAYEWKKDGGFWRLEGSYAPALTDLATDAGLDGVFRAFRTRTFALKLGWWFETRRFWGRISTPPDP